ncbi:AGAP003755-PA-like protein [Anopheles sinensis]|uniref:AGAP003755-PA-like protein n=1 Tax=Anopheles sinensis TaxID=74873 RepID=A0A084WQ97_ANOSI|nr:AGAP003755-PA-like protein [Anopheles sinensis]
MGLAVAATSVSTKTFRSDAVEEMAPALTEPLSQSKLSSSAASGASPRTSSSTTTTATVTATLGGTTLLPSADDQQQPQQQQQQLLQEVVENYPEQQVVGQQDLPPVVVEGLAEGVVADATTTPQGQREATLDEMGMSLPVTSGDGGSTTVDDIQNNNSASGGQALLKQLEQDSNRDLVEIALEQMHHDTAALVGSGAGGGAEGATAMDAILDAGGTVGGMPSNILQPPAVTGPQHSDFVLMDINNTPSKSVLHNRYFHGVSTSGPKSATVSSSSLPPSLADAAAPTSSAGGDAGAGGYANISNTIPLFDRAATQELEQTAGLLHAELRHVQNTIDSDATLSSSGGDSADESMPYVNELQEPLTM